MLSHTLRTSVAGCMTAGLCEALSVRCFAGRAGPGDLKPLVKIPEKEFERKAQIYQPSGPSGQYGYQQKIMNGGARTPWHVWLPSQEVWNNPLMGWASSSDTAEGAYRRLSFDTAEAAAEFLKTQGLDYEIIDKPPSYDSTYRPPRYAGYGDNFSTKRKGIPDLSHLTKGK